jgi:cell division septum initiation protein DivIVA
MDLMFRVEDRLNTLIGKYNALKLENDELKKKLQYYENNTIKIENEAQLMVDEVEELLSKEVFDEDYR